MLAARAIWRHQRAYIACRTGRFFSPFTIYDWIPVALVGDLELDRQFGGGDRQAG
jgi:hypothetical protein